MELNQVKQFVLESLSNARIAITPAEAKNIEIADMGLGRLEEIGLEIITYINTDRCCSKELIMLPNQICPEHRHPPVNGLPGKEETFRCRQGIVYLYVEGKPTIQIKGVIPPDCKEYFTVFHEVILSPGEQYTLTPNTLHWFQAGPEGAIVSEFSTTSRDELDIFTDPNISRKSLR